MTLAPPVLVGYTRAGDKLRVAGRLPFSPSGWSRFETVRLFTWLGIAAAVVVPVVVGSETNNLTAAGATLAVCIAAAIFGGVKLWNRSGVALRGATPDALFIEMPSKTAAEAIENAISGGAGAAESG